MIDVNIFFGAVPDSAPQFIDAAVLEKLREDGIQEMFLTSTNAFFYDAERGNREVVKLAERYDYISPVMVFPLDAGHIKDIDIQPFLDTAVPLCRLPIGDGVDIAPKDKPLYEFLDRFSDKGRGVLVNYCSGARFIVDAMARDYQNLSFIMTGINYPEFRGAFGLMERHKNIYLEISCFQLYRGLEYLVKHIGAERLIFGTNSPFYAYQSSVLKLKKANISENDRKAIATDNLLRILGSRDK